MSSPTEDFKRAAAMFPSGVAAVTAAHDGLVHGITVSAFSSLSLDPPQVLVCVSRWSRLNQLVLAANAFTVNVLAADQEQISEYFATPGREPVSSFDEIGLSYLLRETRIPIIEGCAAFFDCTVVMVCESGDHAVYMGDVLAAGSDPSKRPLLYFDRRYRTMVDG